MPVCANDISPINLMMRPASCLWISLYHCDSKGHWRWGLLAVQVSEWGEGTSSVELLYNDGHCKIVATLTGMPLPSGEVGRLGWADWIVQKIDSWCWQAPLGESVVNTYPTHVWRAYQQKQDKTNSMTFGMHYYVSQSSSAFVQDAALCWLQTFSGVVLKKNSCQFTQ